MDIDFKIGGEDQAVLLKSSDGKVFSISKERVSQSEVWKGMLELENGTEQNKGQVIQLDENSEALKLFLSSLVISKWAVISITVDQVIEQLKMSDKYQAPTSAFFLSWARIYKEQWHFSQIVQVNYYSTLLKVGFLQKLAAKQFITLGQEWVVDAVSKEINPLGLMELIQYKQNWCKNWSNPHRGSVGCWYDFKSPDTKERCEAGWNRAVQAMIIKLGNKSESEVFDGMCSGHRNQFLRHYNAMMRDLLSL